MIVTVKHLRKAKYCIPGTKMFFDRHGLNWRKFCREGLPEEEFIETGDKMALNLVEIAHGRK